LLGAAERAGFESVWTVEHVVLPVEYEPLYPETADGRIPFAPGYPIADPLVWMAFAAAHTSRLKLGTGVLVVPQRNALVLAKEAATLHRLSGGRIILGVGAGWLREEFEALGVGFEDRGRRLDDTIAAMRALWTGKPATHTSDSWAFRNVVSSPTPPGDHVPIHVGGFTMPAARRAGRSAEGFFPGGYDREVLARLIRRCRAEAEAHGRDPAAIEITTRWTRDPAALTDLSVLDHLAEIGVDRVTVPQFIFDADGFEDRIEEFGENVIARTGPRAVSHT
jgi:probable F420-dependent oxidoreductase